MTVKDLINRLNTFDENSEVELELYSCAQIIRERLDNYQLNIDNETGTIVINVDNG